MDRERLLVQSTAVRSGRTYRLVTEAMQNLDFHDAVLFAVAQHKMGDYVLHLALEIAKELEFKITRVMQSQLTIEFEGGKRFRILAKSDLRGDRFTGYHAAVFHDHYRGS